MNNHTGADALLSLQAQIAELEAENQRLQMRVHELQLHLAEWREDAIATRQPAPGYVRFEDADVDTEPEQTCYRVVPSLGDEDTHVTVQSPNGQYMGYHWKKEHEEQAHDYARLLNHQAGL